jgi:hypothetical protein
MVLYGCKLPPDDASTTAPSPSGHREAARDVRAASVKYQPIEPVSFWTLLGDQPGIPSCRAIDTDLSCSDLEILGNFPNDATQVAIFQLDASGDIRAPFVTSSARGSSYRVIVDYVKFRSDTSDGCLYRSGVGIRLKAELTTTSAKADISSPIGLGVSAQLGRVRGSLSFETIGISGKSITPLIPIPSQISAESIQKAIEAAASIKAILYTASAAGDVVIEPQVFALKCDGNKTPSEAIGVPGPEVTAPKPASIPENTTEAIRAGDAPATE